MQGLFLYLKTVVMGTPSAFLSGKTQKEVFHLSKNYSMAIVLSYNNIPILYMKHNDNYLQMASASKYLEFRWSITIISCCLSRKHSSADSGVRAMLHLYPALSQAHQNPSLCLSSFAKISNTCKKNSEDSLTLHITPWNSRQHNKVLRGSPM